MFGDHFLKPFLGSICWDHFWVPLFEAIVGYRCVGLLNGMKTNEIFNTFQVKDMAAEQRLNRFAVVSRLEAKRASTMIDGCRRLITTSFMIIGRRRMGRRRTIDIGRRRTIDICRRRSIVRWWIPA